MQDPYLEDQLARFVGVGPKSVVEEPHPFAAAANPLMTMIAFLSSSVDPRGSSPARLSLSLFFPLFLFVFSHTIVVTTQSRRRQHRPLWR